MFVCSFTSTVLPDQDLDLDQDQVLVWRLPGVCSGSVCSFTSTVLPVHHPSERPAAVQPLQMSLTSLSD